jgi:predicted amidohydrolase
MSKKDESVRRPAKGPRIGLAQISPALGDAEANLALHRSAIEKAAADGVDLLVFPELSLAGYRLKDSVPDVGLTRDSDTWKELEKLSEQVAFVAGFVEETPDHLFYNSAAYFEAGRCVAVHRKTYLPTYGMFDEQRYFARGRNIAAFDTKLGRVAILICEDMLHPSAVTIAACDGATLLIVPSVSPARGVTGEGEADSNARSWESYLQVMARSFGVWVAYCNRVGVEDGVSFWGGSEIVSPAGERLAKAAYYDEDSVTGVLSDDAVRRRRIANPLVRDEDLDLTINELSRIRGRAVETSEEDDAPRRVRSADYGDRPPRRDRRAGEFEDAPSRGPRDGDAPPKRFGGPGRFDSREHRPPAGFRPRGGFEERGGGFDKPRFNKRDDDGPRFGAPRGRFGDDAEGGRVSRPRFGDGPPRGKFGDGPPPRGRFGDGPPPRGKFGDGPPRGKFGDGPPRGKFGDGPPRGKFGDGPPRGRFGDGPPRGKFGDGPPRGKFGDGPPRGRFGDAPRGRDDGGSFGPPRGKFGAAQGDKRPGGFKPRFGDAAPRPRERQRPDPARKPFGKGKPRGRKDD